MAFLAMSSFDGREALAWLVFVSLLGWALLGAGRWLMARFGQRTRWGRRTRTQQGMRRTRDGLLERYSRGELTEAEYRERLRVLEQEGRSGP